MPVRLLSSLFVIASLSGCATSFDILMSRWPAQFEPRLWQYDLYHTDNEGFATEPAGQMLDELTVATVGTRNSYARTLEFSAVQRQDTATTYRIERLSTVICSHDLRLKQFEEEAHTVRLESNMMAAEPETRSGLVLETSDELFSWLEVDDGNDTRQYAYRTKLPCILFLSHVIDRLGPEPGASESLRYFNLSSLLMERAWVSLESQLPNSAALIKVAHDGQGELQPVEWLWRQDDGTILAGTEYSGRYVKLLQGAGVTVEKYNDAWRTFLDGR